MKVSGVQIFWMICIMDMGMTLLMTMTSSLQAAKQDAWMSMLIAGCIAILIALLATQLAKLYPDQTLVQFSQTIMGRWLGKVIVVIYLVQWYTIIPIVLRQFSDLLDLLLLPNTPRGPVCIMMLLLTVYVTSGGIGSIGRCSEILGPLILIMVMIVLVSNINNIEFRQLLPVYVDNGMAAVLKGALAPASYLGHAIEFIMLASFLATPRKGAPFVYWGVIIAILFVTISTIMVTITVGSNIASKMWYPFFEMTKQISVFQFIENLDALAVAIWMSSVFIKLSIYMFITSYGTAQFLNIKNWKTLIWFIAPVVMVLSLFPKNVIEATSNYLMNYWVPIVLPINMIGLPLLLLIVGKIKQRKQQTCG